MRSLMFEVWLDEIGPCDIVLHAMNNRAFCQPTDRRAPRAKLKDLRSMWQTSGDKLLGLKLNPRFAIFEGRAVRRQAYSMIPKLLPKR